MSAAGQHGARSIRPNEEPFTNNGVVIGSDAQTDNCANSSADSDGFTAPRYCCTVHSGDTGSRQRTSCAFPDRLKRGFHNVAVVVRI